MHDQYLAGSEIGEQIFGAAAKPLDARPDEPLREIVRQRPAQVFAVGLNGQEGGAFHGRHKTPPHRFHLGKFRHVYSIGRFPGI
jgi:hypothetical protein